MWGFLACKSSEANCLPQPCPMQNPSCFQHDGDRRSVVVGSGARIDSIVVGAHDDGPILRRFTRHLSHQIRDFQIMNPVRLPRHRMPGPRQLPFDEGCCGIEGSGAPCMTWSNQARQPVHTCVRSRTTSSSLCSCRADISDFLSPHKFGQVAGSLGVGSTNLNIARLSVHLFSRHKVQVLTRTHRIRVLALIEIRKPHQD